MSKVLNRIYGTLVADRWTLGFIDEPLSDIVNDGRYNIHYVSGIPRDRWYADPFILDYNDKTIELLVEEFQYKRWRGRIAHITIDKKTYKLVSEKIILDIDTHLSFPFIVREGNTIYVFPENSMSNSWNKYEYDRKNDRLLKIKSIINEPLTDAVVVKAFGNPLVFSTRQPDANGNVLYVFTKEGVITKEISFASKVARGAGDWFSIDGMLYRPAQDCNGVYGKAVIIQKVEVNSEGLYTFTDVRRIESTNPNHKRGCHTFNSYKDLTVVDVNGYRWGVIGTLTDMVKELFKLICKH